MTKMDEKVNEILGLNSLPEEKKEVKEFSPPVKREDDKSKADVDNDYKYSRDNYYNLIEKGQEAIQGILDIAKEGQHPRAYEVAGQLIGQVGQTVDKLQDLNKKLKDLKDVPNKTNTNIKQALFVGSSKELHSLLKNKNKNITPKEDMNWKDEVEGYDEFNKKWVEKTI